MAGDCDGKIVPQPRLRGTHQEKSEYRNQKSEYRTPNSKLRTANTKTRDRSHPSFHPSTLPPFHLPFFHSSLSRPALALNCGKFSLGPHKAGEGLTRSKGQPQHVCQMVE